MKEERDNLINPYWLEDKALTRGTVDFLTGRETQFWKDMIEKYLYPIDENKAEQVRTWTNHHPKFCFTFKR